jgi:peptide/nickel transport system substrate-binding protein
MNFRGGRAVSLIFVLVVSSVAGVFLLSAGAVAPAKAAGPTALNLGLSRFATFPSLNPFTPTNTHPVVAEMYLECNYKTDPPDPVPMELALCSSWGYTGNYTTFTMNLRPGLKWSDGSPLNASDFAYSLYLYNYTGFFSIPIRSITIVNSTAVSATMSTPTPNFMWSITDAYLVPKEIFGHIPLADIENFTNFGDTSYGPIVGAGPYVISSYVTGTNPLVMAANPYYYQGTPYYDELVIHMFQGSYSAYADSLLSGQLDALWVESSGSTIKPFENLPGYSITSFPESDALDRIVPNTNIYPFSNTYFRQGLAYATNRSAIAETINGPGYTLINYGLYGSSTNLGYPAYSYNLATAEGLFTQAGLKNVGSVASPSWEYQNGTKVSITVLFPSTDPDSGNIATILTSQWQTAGFQVTPVSEDAVSVYAATAAGHFSVAVFLAFSAIDLTNCCTFLDGIQGSSYLFINENGTYLSPQLPKLLNSWYTTPSESPAQDAISEQIGAIVAKYVPIIPLFELSSYEVYRNSIWFGSPSDFTGLFDTQIVGQPVFFQTTLYYSRPVSVVNGSAATQTCGVTCTAISTTTTTPTVTSTVTASATVTSTAAVTTSATVTTTAISTSISSSVVTTTAVSSATVVSTTTASSSNTTVYALVGIVVILLIVVVAIAIMMSRRTRTTTSTTSSTTSTAPTKS